MPFDLEKPQALIGGKWVDTPQSARLNNPYTLEPFATVGVADERMIDSALAAAQAGFAKTRAMAPYERSDLLRAAADAIERRRTQLAETIVAEAGKPVTLAEAEVTRASATFTAASEEARRCHGELLDMEAFAAGRGHFGIMRRFPLGVIYGITPFNFPLNLVAHKVAPALASGNAIVVKPSPRTPLSALLLGDILTKAGAPAGAVNVINVPNALAGRALADERVKHVSFTGSVPVGWSIKKQAGNKRVTLELGGNAGLIVHEDADLGAAIAAAATGAFSYAGQSCISVQRIVVHAPIYAAFRDRFITHVRENIRAGDPSQRDTLVGPLIDSAAVERVRGLIDDALRNGAKVLTGGDWKRNILEPTVLESVDPRLEICASEAFAPIATLHSYDDFDDAIRFVNESPFGLQAGVFTRDTSRAMRAFEQLEVGGVMINQSPTFRVENMPYGGVKASGSGREGIRYAMEEMTEMRVLVLRL